jgi:ectoine hydroxylase-related dioxygenase (phytanoyl-CoA dioxygenase family)
MHVFAAAELPDSDTVRRIIHDHGCMVVTGVLDADYLSRAKAALERAIAKEVEYHGSNDYIDYGMVLVCAIYGREFLEPFENPRLMGPLEAVLGPGCIVYAYTSSSMPPNRTNYSRRIHRDVPTGRMNPSYLTNVGATILLDDFTLENGASYFLEDSHTRKDPPAQDEFYAKAYRLVAPAGSVMFCDPLVYHAGGDNKTDRWRHAITISMCRPWMKQRLDLPRLLEGTDLTGVSERVLQKLGFRAQVPASYDEYYAPPERRKYRQAVE